MPDLRINTRNQLVRLARTLGVRSDWREPDEQGLSARVYGDSLDNAMPPGTWMGVDGRGVPHAELYVVLLQDDGADTESRPRALINLATLLAWATGYDEVTKGLHCTCETSGSGDPETPDVTLNPDCPRHGTEARYAALGRRYEGLMTQLAAARGRAGTDADGFDLGSYESLERFALRAAKLARMIADSGRIQDW